MPNSDSAARELFHTFLEKQLGLTPDECDDLFLVLLPLCRLFPPELLERQSGCLKKLLAELKKRHAFSCTQYQHALSFLFCILSSENCPAIRQKGEYALRLCFTEEEQKNLTNMKLSRLVIKLLLPTVYDLSSFREPDGSLLFMQPRQGLNESFRYFYHILEENYPGRVKLYEFHRETVSFAEYCVNAAFFIRDMARADAVFVHESNNLMGYLNIRPETRVIQLWHGCGVFKHLGLSTAGKEGFRSKARYREFPEYNKYSLVTIASPELSWVFEEFMGIPADSDIIQPLGVCRTDEQYDPGYVDTCYQKLYEAIPAARGKKVILYAPTYRGMDPNRYSPDQLDIKLFQKELGDEYILILKHHQTVLKLPEIPASCRDTFAWDMTRGKGMNINELMTVADVCITDYSSVAFEFSVFERPLLFFVYDLEEYIDNRGLYYDFGEITPGPLCRTTREMADYILQLKNGFDSSVVADFRKRFMCCCDGHACERTLHFLHTNCICYSGNGADSLQPPADPNRLRTETSKSGDLRLIDSVSHPIPSEYQLLPNPFTRKGWHFAGWNLHQYEGAVRYWLCTDQKWHSTEEIEETFLKKVRFADQAQIHSLTLKNGNYLFLSACWKPDSPAEAVSENLKALHLKKRGRRILKNMYHAVLKR